ncbi:MAG: YebC/PmpR family DNA-binding transcriptional regulator [Patescibacteria group bacterium]|jgi:YebC/PmpR family DNA-binding regulatory protein
MSGHSKWATTKRAKEAKDAKKSNLFTKLSKNISVAARSGSDPEANFKLRMAIDKAKAYSMPKDNIDRAVKKGSGEGEAKIETYLYEGFGPGGVALIVEVLSDNKNRSVSNLKHIFSKHGGNLGGDGSVQWMFEIKGQIILNQTELTEEEEMKIIEAGAEDIDTSDEKIKVITHLDELETVKNKLQAANFQVESSEMIYLAKEKIISDKEEQLLKLLDALDDDDDVNNIYTNTNI